MATNRTARTASELEADGERMCDGLRDHGAAVGIKSNVEPVVRPVLEALKAASAAFGQAQSEETRASQAAQAADDANAAFIAQFVHWMSMLWGGQWSERWIGTGLPDRVAGVPRTVAKRFVALNGIAAFLEAHPEFALSHPLVELSAARARGLYEAFSDLDSAANAKRGVTVAAKMARNAAFKAFRKLYRYTIWELGVVLGNDDPRWMIFGLRVPDAAETPEAPRTVSAEAVGGGAIIVKTKGARRARSLNYYRKIVGVDAEPVKVENFRAKELLIDNLPARATVEITIRGVNEAGEGRACEPVSVAVA